MWQKLINLAVLILTLVAIYSVAILALIWWLTS